MNNARLSYNLWSFVHIHILYVYQRTSIMVWLNTLNGLSSKFIKTLRFNFNYINLYKNSVVYILIFIALLLLI